MAQTQASPHFLSHHVSLRRLPGPSGTSGRPQLELVRYKPHASAREFLLAHAQHFYTTLTVFPGKLAADLEAHIRRLRKQALAQISSSGAIREDFSLSVAVLRDIVYAALNSVCVSKEHYHSVVLVLDAANCVLHAHSFSHPYLSHKEDTAAKDQDKIIVEARNAARTEPTLKDCAWVKRRAWLEQLRGKEVVETLLMDENGRITEGCVTNVFIKGADDIWRTAPKEFVLAGVMRERVLQAFGEFNEQVREVAHNVKDEAKGLFITNALRGVQDVNEVRVWDVEGSDGELGARKWFLNDDDVLVEKVRRRVWEIVRDHATNFDKPEITEIQIVSKDNLGLAESEKNTDRPGDQGKN